MTSVTEHEERLLSRIKQLEIEAKRSYSDGYQQARADMHDHVEPMIDVADRFAHRMAMVLECVLMDRASDRWWNEGMQLIGEYRMEMNRIHERHSPTHMGEPVLPKMDLEEARKTMARNWAREHITTGEPCWCNPETTYKDPDTGISVIVHKEPQ